MVGSIMLCKKLFYKLPDAVPGTLVDIARYSRKLTMPLDALVRSSSKGLRPKCSVVELNEASLLKEALDFGE